MYSKKIIAIPLRKIPDGGVFVKIRMGLPQLEPFTKIDNCEGSVHAETYDGRIRVFNENQLCYEL
ncbi:hypothetical protein C7447_102257 [Tenacibaculum adriaticum]|uniref:Uncharacterized protein n=1 Tax=Tenacibaculum adriaticum TaxID=413713 RepID=A0A5S5DWC1_9FLAO|nr:hypothetical protein [Tenacibaculum adriaticum]TYP98939.1 hypothetical protein C7447_102257 [Tenacibaculum adriaticum]